MGLKLYETEEHLEAEKKFVGKVEKRFNCRSIKLPIRWEIDYLFDRYDEKTKKWWGIAWGELKCRNHLSTDFETVICGEHKIRHGIFISRRLGNLPFIFFVRFKDKDVWCKMPQEQDSLLDFRRERFRAGNHQADKSDIEWVIHFPREIFKEF